MVYNILGQITGFLVFTGIALFMARLVWSLIPRLIREPIIFMIKVMYKASKPILAKSKVIGKEVSKDMKKSNSKKANVNYNKKKSNSFKKTKYSHLKVVK